jgi:hypothetical protein
MKRSLNFTLCLLAGFSGTFAAIQGKLWLALFYLIALVFFWNQTMRD